MKLGFIGCGNMAGAMMGGIIKNNIFKSEDVYGSDVFEPSRERVKNMYGIHVSDNNVDVVDAVDVLVLAVKPQYYESVITQIKDHVRADQLIITIAPGKTLSWLAEKFGKDVKIVRTMPNTPALVGEGMTGATPNEFVTEAELKYVCEILSGFSKVEVISEKLMDTVVAVSGSSPAYIFMFIEAMADAAVEQGMPRAQAYKFAAQAVMGSAKMVLETGKHPGELKDMVCSPAGTTIKAVRVLEKEGLRSAVIEAMDACVDAAKGMVAWAKNNLAESGLADRPVRFIVDDVMKFVQREKRRGRSYEGILMDPPSYGRGPDGEMWRTESGLYPLVSECMDLLSDDAGFFIINSYTTGLAPAVLRNVLKLASGRRGGRIDAQEIGIPISNNELVLPCGCTARWYKEPKA